MYQSQLRRYISYLLGVCLKLAQRSSTISGDAGGSRRSIAGKCRQLVFRLELRSVTGWGWVQFVSTLVRRRQVGEEQLLEYCVDLVQLSMTGSNLTGRFYNKTQLEELRVGLTGRERFFLGVLQVLGSPSQLAVAESTWQLLIGCSHNRAVTYIRLCLITHPTILELALISKN